jgi:hypothetical protein
MSSIGVTFEGTTTAADLVSAARSRRVVLQDFQRLEESLDWRLSNLFFQRRGIGSFVSANDSVPFVINNSGNLSSAAAGLLLASLAETTENTNVRESVFLLELGLGTGLFARYLLDALASRCRNGKENTYDRMCYVATDQSDQMLTDIARKGILSGHPGRFRLAQLDATRVDNDLAQAIAKAKRQTQPFQAIFVNYLLDVLPATVLRVQNGHVSEIYVRTCLARGVDLREHSHLCLEDICLRAASRGIDAQRDLIDLYPLFAIEYEFRPVDVERIPYGRFAVKYANDHGQRFLVHNYGAFRCLEGCLKVLADGGFILINDYPINQAKTSADECMYQKFAGSTAIGLNFPLLRAYFEAVYGVEWVEPAEDDPNICARMLCREIGAATRAEFYSGFGKRATEHRQEPQVRARTLLQTGRTEAALRAYEEALARQPSNWQLACEVAKLLIFTVRDYAAGVKIARAGLVLNRHPGRDEEFVVEILFVGLSGHNLDDRSK